jgi:hypothetical protein
MMAGLGNKIWATDDILTAVDLNGYLADQVTMVFASVAARTAGIASPSEGMVTYLSDSNSLWHYSGTGWVNIPTAAVGTASDSLKIDGSTVFIQAGTPTALATNDLWFW